MECKSLLVDFNYVKFKKAIPQIWLEKSNHNPLCLNSFEEDFFEIKGGEIINVKNMRTKEFYSLVLKYRSTESLSLQYWRYKLGLSFDFEWKNVLLFKLKDIKLNKVRQFNFKLLHNILPFKINLCRWKLASDTSCLFCDEEETFTHIMLQCSHVSNFWTKLISLCYTMFKTRITADEKMLLIGYEIHDKQFMLINLLIVFA